MKLKNKKYFDWISLKRLYYLNLIQFENIRCEEMITFTTKISTNCMVQ